MPRFFVDTPPLEKVVITGEDAFHASALRIRIGEEVVLCDGNSTDYLSKCISAKKGEYEFAVLSSCPSIGEPKAELRLYQCLPKGDKMDDIVQKAVELGATSITPVLSERCISRPDQKALAKKIARWGQIAKEASMQSGRGIIVPVNPCITYKGAVEEMVLKPCPILLYENECQKGLGSLALSNGASILVGPEGGMSEGEVSLAMSSGINVITLGKRILRTQTAGICALSVINYIMGD